MPTVTPSEKTGHEGEWWRKDHGDEQEPTDHQSKDAKNTPDDSAIMRDVKFDEEELPVEYPS